MQYLNKARKAGYVAVASRATWINAGDQTVRHVNTQIVSFFTISNKIIPSFKPPNPSSVSFAQASRLETIIVPRSSTGAESRI